MMPHVEALIRDSLMELVRETDRELSIKKRLMLSDRVRLAAVALEEIKAAVNNGYIEKPVPST